MRSRLRLGHLGALPRREELEALARHYHHLQNEHKRAAPQSGMRRRIEDRLLQVRRRFDQVLAEWVPEEDFRRAWRDHLHYRAPKPPGPPPIPPLVFRGRSEARSVVEIRGKKGEELDVEIDGALVERIAAAKDFAITGAPARYRYNRTEFRETFSVSPDALQALADFLAEGGSPPWQHASELLGDGLIDVHVALTPRGRRALSRRAA
jgi:hypothetical protein